MPFYRRHREIQPIASINLTSLLDVTFVLLLAFMIVAPTLKTGLKIDLPEVKDSTPLTTRKSVTISLKMTDGPESAIRIYLENKRIDESQLERDLGELRARHGEKLDIVIEPDRLVPCENLLQILGLTNKIGIESVGVLTAAEKK